MNSMSDVGWWQIKLFLPHEWPHGKILKLILPIYYFSALANRKDIIDWWFFEIIIVDIGNEEVLKSTKIIQDPVLIQEDNGELGGKITFYFDSYEECKEECDSR